jgi:YD repeat-containing protein
MRAMTFTGLEFSMAPYPGLRAFRPEEADIFFGRERQTDQLLDKLARHRFLAVVGPSGCGKSSLVRAGLMPALTTGFIAAAGSHWHVAYMRPAASPLSSLADALMRVPILNEERGAHSCGRAFVEATLRRGPLGLVDLVASSSLTPGANLVVLVDQFEELFRFTSGRPLDEIEAFVAVLLASAAAPDARIYVVITMRADFLGDCAAFHGLPEAINDGLYLTPRLTREECAGSITRPARMFGTSIEDGLVNRLLNDCGPDPDQLPLLQHTLLRMWNRHSRNGRDATVLTGDDYDAVGGLARSLASHADAILADLSPYDRRVAEVMFRRLSDCDTGKIDRRSPATVQEIADIAAVDLDDVRRVADAFRRPGRSFLTPADDVRLRPGTVLDVSHESLLRQWGTLADWIQDETQHVALFRRLKDASQEWVAARASGTSHGLLWSGVLLDRAIAWRTACRPTAAWAARYATRQQFDDALHFLDASEVAREAARARAAHARRFQRRRRLAMLASMSGAITIAIIVLAHHLLYVREHACHYRSYVRVWGAARGIDRLTADQVESRPMSYRIVTHGWLGRTERMEVVDSRDEITNGTSDYAAAGASDPMTAVWEYQYRDDGGVASEFQYAKNGTLTVGRIFTQGTTGETLSYFIGPETIPVAVTWNDESAPYWSESIRYDDEGREHLVRYRGRDGSRAPGRDRAFAARYDYDSRGRVTRLTSLDRHGHPMNDRAGNAVLALTYDHDGNTIEQRALDSDGHPTDVIDGFAIVRSGFDGAGNEVRRAYFDSADRPVAARDGWHRSQSVFAGGNLVDERFFDTDGTPTVDAANRCARRKLEYERQRGLLRRWTCLGPAGAPTTSRHGYTSVVLGYDGSDRIVSESYFDRDGKPVISRHGYAGAVVEYGRHGRVVSRSFLDREGKSTINAQGYARVKTDYSTDSRVESATFLDLDGRPVSGPDGYATIDRLLDDLGKTYKEVYRDVAGRPARSIAGHHGVRRVFDGRGLAVETMYLGIDGQPAVTTEGSIGTHDEYDDLGRHTKRTNVDLRGAPVASAQNGVVTTEMTYDRRGHLIGARYLSADGKLMTLPEGHASYAQRMDVRGNPLEIEYRDLRDAPTLTSWTGKRFSGAGYARRSQRYSPQGDLLEKAYYGVDNEPVIGPGGWARSVSVYDVHGNVTRTAYYDHRGAAVRIDDMPGGYHAVEYTLDDRGNATEVRYVDTDGVSLVATHRHLASFRSTFDANGRPTTVSFFGTQGEATTSDDGFHSVTMTRDRFGRSIQREFRDSHGNIIDVEETEYDAWNEVLEVRHSSDKHACAIKRTLRSRPDEIIEDMCLDHERNLRPGLDNEAARVTYQWNTAGKLATKTLYDAQGRPFAPTELGYATIRYKYDDLGRTIEMALHDGTGKRTSRELTSYDEMSNVTEVVLLDGNDNPARPVGRIVYRYDQLRRRTSASLFQGGGRPARLASIGQHATHFEYDDFGNIQRLHYTDARGRLTRGYAYEYDERWRACRTWYATYEKGMLTGDGICVP